MARHLMAVCVVCLLCADHLPCKQHFEETTNTQGFIPNLNSVSIADQRYVDTLHLPNGNQRYFEHSPYLVNKRRGRTKRSHGVSAKPVDAEYSHEKIELINQQRRQTDQLVDESSSAQNNILSRIKRHGSHHEEHADTHHPAEYFVQELFKRFGDPETETMSVMQFELMMHKLNMYNLIEKEQVFEDKPSASKNKTGQCISSKEFVKRVSSNVPSSAHPPPPSIDTQTSLNITQNTTSSIVPVSNQSPLDVPPALLNANDLVAICPILLYQLTANNSSSRAGCIDPQLIDHNFGHKHIEKIELHQDRTLGEFELLQPKKKSQAIYFLFALIFCSATDELN